MSFTFALSPEVHAKTLPAWFLLNTYLQKALTLAIHLEPAVNLDQQLAMVAADRLDLIYANPCLAADLIRQRHFVALASPTGDYDETLVAVRQDHPARRVEDLRPQMGRPPLAVGVTEDPDVLRMGRILLEPADLDRTNTRTVPLASYIVIAKEILRGQVDLGFFLEKAFNELSPWVRADLRVLIRGRISVIRHCLMVGPRLWPVLPALRQAIAGMNNSPNGQAILKALGCEGWDLLEQEDVEFMIDLMDTLDEEKVS